MGFGEASGDREDAFFNHLPSAYEVGEAANRAFRTGQSDPGEATDNWLSGYVQALYDAGVIDGDGLRARLDAIADGSMARETGDDPFDAMAARASVEEICEPVDGEMADAVDEAYAESLAEEMRHGEYDRLMADIRGNAGQSPREYCEAHGVEIGGDGGDMEAWKAARFDLVERAAEAAVQDQARAWAAYMYDYGL